jgi:hypothetical protein
MAVTVEGCPQIMPAAKDHNIVKQSRQDFPQEYNFNVRCHIVPCSQGRDSRPDTGFPRLRFLCSEY